MKRLLYRLIKLSHMWETVQVELQGCYSLARFRELLVHAKTPSRATDFVFLFVSPLPGFVWLLIFDALPTRSPFDGLQKQTMWTLLRLWTSSVICAFVCMRNAHQSSPSLPLSTTRLLAISCVAAVANCLSIAMLGALLIFPTPLSVQISVVPYATVGLSLLYWSWRDALRADAEAKRKVSRYVQALVAQINLMTAYIVYSCAFTMAGKNYQVYVSLSLPLLKMIFKNIIRKGLYYIEDLAPVLVVCNVDVYHAMYVSSTLQQTKGLEGTAFILLVDVIQALVAYYEVVTIVRKVNKAAEACKDVDRYATSGCRNSTSERRHSSQRVASRLKSLLTFHYSPIDYANYLIETNPRIRNHPSIALPRHLQDEHRKSCTLQQPGSEARVLPHDSWSLKAVSVSGPAREPTISCVRSTLLTQTEQMQTQCVALVLKMLHMIEFYVLVEYVEVAIAFVYALYVYAMTWLPNRVYYKQFEKLNDEQIQAAAVHLAKYASLELVSLILFCWVINRQLEHMSSVQRLAFVLRKEWKTVIPTITVWVIVVVQLSFQHFGMDYSLQFAWTRGRPAT